MEITPIKAVFTPPIGFEVRVGEEILLKLNNDLNNPDSICCHCGELDGKMSPGYVNYLTVHVKTPLCIMRRIAIANSMKKYYPK